ncbi:MAG: FAD-dependent oxidoreductase [Polyangiaceae bacterium]|nr:FAD-dependent oxidoreductase [Polyangiaceae bacterium]
MARTRARRVVVVGGGVAGLAAALELCRAGVPVDVLCATSLRRSHVEGSPAGLNAALGDGDSPRDHAADALRVGQYLASQARVLALALAAPELVHVVERLGVPLQGRADGSLLLRRLPGSTRPRTAFAGAATGLELVHALDAELARHELAPATDARGAKLPGEPLARRFEHWDLCELVLDGDGACVGCVAQDLRTMDVRAFRAEAVVLAESGPSLARTSSSGVPSAEHALAVALRAGAVAQNLELQAFHPTGLGGPDRQHVLSELAFAEGARLWVPLDRKERRAPEDVPEREREHLGSPGELGMAATARALVRAFAEGRGIFDPEREVLEPLAWLDLEVHKRDAAELELRLGASFETYRALGPRPRTRAGHETLPYRGALKVGVAPGRSLGGLWVDFAARADATADLDSPRNHATTLAGLYAAGPVACSPHGAGALPGDELVGDLFGGRLAARAAAAYRAGSERSASDQPSSTFEAPESAVRAAVEKLREREGDGEDSPYAIADELAQAMGASCGPLRDDAALDALLATQAALAARLEATPCPDRATRANQAVPFMRHLAGALDVARLAVAGARARAESRGVHYKPAAPTRDDAGWLRATLLRLGASGPELVGAFASPFAERVTDAVDTALFAPEPGPAAEPAVRVEAHDEAPRPAKKKKRAGKPADEEPSDG